MRTKDYKIQFMKWLNFLCIVMICCGIFVMPASAEAAKTEVVGRVYTFEKDSHYEFSDSKKYDETSEVNTYGTFSISGDISNVSTKGKVPAYEVGKGDLKIFYNHGDDLLQTDNKDTWHLIEDKSNKFDGNKLDEDIKTGLIILQTSNDSKNWIDVVNITDAFEKKKVRTDAIYTTEDVQLINGCYYRLIVAYELRIRTKDDNFLFVNTDKFDYKKCVELYEFYACTTDAEEVSSESSQTYSLGSKVRVEDFDSYSGEETITKDDAHYGWNLGDFFVSGYTDEVKNSDGTVTFLKNVGDKVTLWFRLNEDLDKLNGNEKLSVTADGAGSDQYFETPTMKFGRGALIIRYTDYNNVKQEPTIYTNYLEANTSVGADTKVQLFEEGDYEVALDYEVTNDQLIDKIGHYRIFFKFSIRNGNCMVYPFDVETGSELTNSSMTENGFRLDLAKSRYLKINLKREMLTESADGLVEDTRFNGPAKDGAEYTDEGIYTITVTNDCTGQFTTKKIYVGENNILRAYMTTGLSIPEINDLVEQGAIISDDGTIRLATTSPVSEESKENTGDEAIENDSVNDSEALAEQEDNFPVIPVVVGGIIVIIICRILVKNSKKKKDSSEGKGEL